MFTYTVFVRKYGHKKKSTTNLTLSIDENLLKSGREYAEKHGTSLNALIRDLLTQKVNPPSTHWVKEMFHLMDQAKVKSSGKRNWQREDLYDL